MTRRTRRTRRRGGEEEEEEDEAGGRRQEEATDIKSNNPHLAGGEKSFLCPSRSHHIPYNILPITSSVISSLPSGNETWQ